MDKVFQALVKPAKWVLIIGGFFYTVWFAIEHAVGFGNSFVSVFTGLLILFVGTALLAATPVLVLFKKDNIAKLFFLFLLGYWVLISIQSWFSYADVFTSLNNGLAITSGIFSLLAGLGLVAIIVLTVLEYVLKKPCFRFISLLVMFGVILIGFVAGLLLFIYAAINQAVWPNGISLFVEFLILPTIICFGYIYFFGIPEKK